MKRENTQICELVGGVEIDGLIVKFIAFDLEHINRGWDSQNNDYNKTVRSSLTESDVIEIFRSTSLIYRDWESGNKQSLNKNWFRHVYNVYREEEKFRLVVDIMKKRNNVATIVTIYERTK